MKYRKRFGQHFLAPAWADKVVEAIAPRREDRFLEIGPGPGVLTGKLAARAGSVAAVEIDRDLAAALRPQLPGNVEIVESTPQGVFDEAAVAAVRKWVYEPRRENGAAVSSLAKARLVFESSN